MRPDTIRIIGPVVVVGAGLAGLMYALVSGTHRRFDDVNNRIDDVQVDL